MLGMEHVPKFGENLWSDVWRGIRYVMARFAAFTILYVERVKREQTPCMTKTNVLDDENRLLKDESRPNKKLQNEIAQRHVQTFKVSKKTLFKNQKNFIVFLFSRPVNWNSSETVNTISVKFCTVVLRLNVFLASKLYDSDVRNKPKLVQKWPKNVLGFFLENCLFDSTVYSHRDSEPRA